MKSVLPGFTPKSSVEPDISANRPESPFGKSLDKAGEKAPDFDHFVKQAMRDKPDCGEARSATASRARSKHENREDSSTEAKPTTEKAKSKSSKDENDSSNLSANSGNDGQTDPNAVVPTLDCIFSAAALSLDPTITNILEGTADAPSADAVEEVSSDVSPNPTNPLGVTSADVGARGANSAVPANGAKENPRPVSSKPKPSTPCESPPVTEPDAASDPPPSALPDVETTLKFDPAKPPEPPVLSPEKGLGTPGAQQEMSMKQAAKMLKSAEPQEKILPVSGEQTPSRQDMPVSIAPSEKLEIKTDFSNNGAGIATFNQPVTVSQVAAVEAPRHTVSLQTLERTSELVSLHALRFQSANTDSLKVSIQPVAGVNLSLELRWKNNEVAAEAVLHNGDFQQMSRHWSELQQQLQGRGVNLAPLQNGNLSDQSPQFSQQQRHSARHDSADTADSIPFETAIFNASAKTRGKVKTNSGLEIWA